MTSEEREKLYALVQRIQKEQDQKTFLKLIEQLNDLLDQARDRSRPNEAAQKVR